MCGRKSWKKVNCHVLFTHKAYSAVIRVWIRYCMKRLENWWLSGSEIRLVAIPYMFPPISLNVSSCFTCCFPSFFEYFPCYSWCFYLFLILGLTILWKYLLDYSQNIVRKIRPGRKLIAVTHMKIIRNYPRGEILPVFKTELKSSRGETSLRVERVTTFKSFLIDDRGNFTPRAKSHVWWASKLEHGQRVINVLNFFP